MIKMIPFSTHMFTRNVNKLKRAKKRTLKILSVLFL